MIAVAFGGTVGGTVGGTLVGTVGVVAWSATTIVFVRHVAEPALHRRLVRRRLADPGVRWRRADPTRTPRLTRRHRRARVDAHEELAVLLDAVGRELRLGASLHAAVLTATGRHPVAELAWLRDVAGDGGSLGEAARRRLDDRGGDPGQRTSLDFVLRVIVAADGADPVHAVESAARTLRATAAIVADSRSAVANTRASIGLLTWIPVVTVALLAARDEQIRRFLLSATGLVCVVAGVLLNWTGRRLVARLTARATLVESDVPDFIDLVSVHLRAGRPPALAFLGAAETAAGPIGEVARRVGDSLRGGGLFVDCLVAARRDFGLPAQPAIDALIDTERDGLPARTLFDRLADEARSQRRREADRRLRELPVRLALPLVGCVLPAYVLLAVVPLLAGQLSSVELDPP